jgi:hypothetical protein
MNSPRLQAWELGIKTIYLGRSRPFNWLLLHFEGRERPDFCMIISFEGIGYS